ncbi:hypothetical protein BOX15_Mlig034418g3 [Macrostomum lignano]|uniref:Uncharacterized protein n=1 Tax=Macrostomum lignano TaxID=282301 RepID=A0A267FRA1_9PLAT|nr:hypothetical protein BOX15_Mlig034418g3 [Macrostomum lignano]
MLRAVVIEQLPGLAVMEIRAKMQTADVISRTAIQHHLITMCWGCHQIVCNSCCSSLCMQCPLFSGRHTTFLQRSWARQLSERSDQAKKSMSPELAPKCPACERLLCVLCDLGICPGCLRPPKAGAQPVASEPPNDCPDCSRRLCSGCGRCECRRCQQELCQLCIRVRPRRCPVKCPSSALTLRDEALPQLANEAVKEKREEPAVGKARRKGKKQQAKDKNTDTGQQAPPKNLRCPACDRPCSLDLLVRVFCCRGRWEPLANCTHGRKAGQNEDEQLNRRLELALCSSAGESCDSEESSEPNGFAELIPPHCRIFTGQCKQEL